MILKQESLSFHVCKTALIFILNTQMHLPSLFFLSARRNLLFSQLNAIISKWENINKLETSDYHQGSQGYFVLFLVVVVLVGVLPPVLANNHLQRGQCVGRHIYREAALQSIYAFSKSTTNTVHIWHGSCALLILG